MNFILLHLITVVSEFLILLLRFVCVGLLALSITLVGFESLEAGLAGMGLGCLCDVLNKAVSSY